MPQPKYKVGDKLPNGSTVTAILDKHHTFPLLLEGESSWRTVYLKRACYLYTANPDGDTPIIAEPCELVDAQATP